MHHGHRANPSSSHTQGGDEGTAVSSTTSTKYKQQEGATVMSMTDYAYDPGHDAPEEDVGAKSLFSTLVTRRVAMVPEDMWLPCPEHKRVLVQYDLDGRNPRVHPTLTRQEARILGLPPPPTARHHPYRIPGVRERSTPSIVSAQVIAILQALAELDDEWDMDKLPLDPDFPTLFRAMVTSMYASVYDSPWLSALTLAAYGAPMELDGTRIESPFLEDYVHVLNTDEICDCGKWRIDPGECRCASRKPPSLPPRHLIRCPCDCQYYGGLGCDCDTDDTQAKLLLNYWMNDKKHRRVLRLDRALLFVLTHELDDDSGMTALDLLIDAAPRSAMVELVRRVLREDMAFKDKNARTAAAETEP